MKKIVKRNNSMQFHALIQKQNLRSLDRCTKISLTNTNLHFYNSRIVVIYILHLL
jgi:hypothetical protein